MLPYQDSTLSPAARAADLVSRMTLEEKVSQMLHIAPGIDRLGILPYNWWNEGLHGVSRAGIATVFPQSIALAATFNPPALRTMAEIIATEGRAKFNEAQRRGDYDYYKGLTFWTPNINLFRDPRWGRGHETYGECPWLTGRLGVEYVQGLQGDDPRYFKLIATPKHYAVHSGPEKDRHHFNSVVSEKDLRESYLPHFEACVNAGAWSIMAAYNRTNGEPCCAHSYLLGKILREEWGFEGFVVSDCGGVEDFHAHHQYTTTPAESAALAVKNGCDLECGCTYRHLGEAHQQGLVSEAEIDLCCSRLMEARVRLGMFDPPEVVPFSRIPFDVVNAPEHVAYSRELARQSMVLLKNDGLLPLPMDLEAITVLGPNADDHKVLLGNYHGTPMQSTTPLGGIRAKVGGATRVFYTPGCELFNKNQPWLGSHQRNFAESMAYSERADVVIAVMGLSAEIEGEQGDAFNSDAGGDRTHIGLPGEQENLLKELAKLGKPIVLVLISGSALAVNFAQNHPNVRAIIQAFYPGPEGGHALAEVLFGDYNPAGRLPVTFYKGLEQLPPFESYAMENRTYRFFKEEPLYPFGFGLSYTKFAYSGLQISTLEGEGPGHFLVSATVTNAGNRAGDEVVQLYIRDVEATTRVPLRDLRGVERVHLAPGESMTVAFVLDSHDLSLVREDGARVLEPGDFEVYVGGSQPDARSRALGATEGVRGVLTVSQPMRGMFEGEAGARVPRE